MDYFPILIFLFLVLPAQAQVIPFGNIKVSAPSSINVSVDRGVLHDVVSNDNVVYLRGKHRLNIQGHSLDIISNRALPLDKIVSITRKAAKVIGPLGLAFAIADLIYDPDTQSWKVPQQSSGAYKTGLWWDPGNGCPDPLPDPQLVCDCRWQVLGGYLENFVFIPTSQTTGKCVRASRPDESSWGDPYLKEETPPPLIPATDEDMDQKIQDAIQDINKRLQQTQHLLDSTPYKRDVIEAADPITQIEGPTTAPKITSTRRTIGPEGTTEETVEETPHIQYKPGTNELSIKNTRQETTSYPDGTTQQKTIEEETDAPKTEQEQQKNECELHPDRIGCLSLGEPQDIELPETDFDAHFVQERTAPGSCPQPISFEYLGNQYELPWDYVCQYASGIRPIVIIIATLTASIWLLAIFRR